MAIHHRLDVKPIPEKVLYINEPELIDASYDAIERLQDMPEPQPDNIRVYVPLDVNADAIMRRLRFLVYRYGEANEENEFNFSADVNRLISQIEIYDQVWFVRGCRQYEDTDGSKNRHSAEAITLVKQFVAELEEIPDGCAELFPFEMIDELKKEYLEP